MLTLLSGLVAGYLATMNLGEEAADADGEGGLIAIIRTAVGGVLTFVVIVFLGGALLLHLGIGDALIKPVIGLIKDWLGHLYGLVGAIVNPIIGIVGARI